MRFQALSCLALLVVSLPLATVAEAGGGRGAPSTVFRYEGNKNEATLRVVTRNGPPIITASGDINFGVPIIQFNPLREGSPEIVPFGGGPAVLVKVVFRSLDVPANQPLEPIVGLITTENFPKRAVKARSFRGFNFCVDGACVDGKRLGFIKAKLNSGTCLNFAQVEECWGYVYNYLFELPPGTFKVSNLVIDQGEGAEAVIEWHWVLRAE